MYRLTKTTLTPKGYFLIWNINCSYSFTWFCLFSICLVSLSFCFIKSQQQLPPVLLLPTIQNWLLPSINSRNPFGIINISRFCRIPISRCCCPQQIICCIHYSLFYFPHVNLTHLTTCPRHFGNYRAHFGCRRGRHSIKALHFKDVGVEATNGSFSWRSTWGSQLKSPEVVSCVWHGFLWWGCWTFKRLLPVKETGHTCEVLLLVMCFRVQGGGRHSCPKIWW